MTYNATIEASPDFPGAGDFVQCDDAVYRVVKDGSRIETQGPGRGNACFGYELERVEWSDVDSDDVRECRVTIEPSDGFRVYHRDEAGCPEAHPAGPWFFEATDYDMGEPFSDGYPTRRDAIEAAYAWEREQAIEAAVDEPLTFRYTIFDANPHTSGPCSWPSHDDVELTADDLDEAIREVREEMMREGLACGEYEEGDRLWAIITDPDGVSHDLCVTLQAEDDEALSSEDILRVASKAAPGRVTYKHDESSGDITIMITSEDGTMETSIGLIDDIDRRGGKCWVYSTITKVVDDDGRTHRIDSVSEELESLDRVRMLCRSPEPVVSCECGEATGVRCEWSGPVSETVEFEWMPPHLRESHRAAGGNSGYWPHNGALRLRVHTECAEMLSENDED